MTAPDENPTVIVAQTRRIEGVITLAEIADRLRRNAGEGAGRADTDPATAERLTVIADLAGRLADELAHLPRS